MYELPSGTLDRALAPSTFGELPSTYSIDRAALSETEPF